MGHGGCIFCSSYGGGEFAEQSCQSVAQQLERAKVRVRQKNGRNGKYIAYFQSFSNTYAPVSRLRQLYYDAIAPEEIVGLAIGTRPDCLGEDVMEVLKEVNATYVHGLTATPVRQDGHQPIIFMQCGPIRYQVDAKRQAEKRAFTHAVIPRFTSLSQPLTDSLPWKITDAYGAEMILQELITKIIL